MTGGEPVATGVEGSPLSSPLSVAQPVQLAAPIPARKPNVQTVKVFEKAEPPLIQRNRSIKILAKSLYRELRLQGYDEKQVVSLATELLGEVTDKVASPKV